MPDYQISIPRYEHGVLGLPGRAVATTNTERSKAACGLRWWFGEAEGLTADVAEPPLRYGRAWHWFLEDLHRWWMHRDEPYPDEAAWTCPVCDGSGYAEDRTPPGCRWCGGNGKGPVQRAWTQWVALERDDRIEVGQADADADRLRRAVEGYLRTYGRGPLDGYRPVGVELRLAAPIVNPATGRPYAPRTWVLVEDGGGMRMARTGEAHDPRARTVQWPMYQVLTIDKLLVERDDPSKLWLWEGKSAADPTGRCRSLSLDPQIHGYAWALKHAAATGLLEGLGVPADARVRGWVFDVASSTAQRDPEPLAPTKVQRIHPNGEPLFLEHAEFKLESDLVLKTRRKAWELDASGEPVKRSPGLSRRRDRNIPSWRYLDRVRELGYDEAEYAEHVAWLAEHKDPGFYVRQWGTCGDEITDRYAAEVFGAARRIAAMRRAAAQATTAWDVARDFPRTPVCATPGGSCPFTGPCVQDGDLVRRNFKISPPTRWSVAIPPDERQETLEWPSP